jgi:ribosomal protein S3
LEKRIAFRRAMKRSIHLSNSTPKELKCIVRAG